MATLLQGLLHKCEDLSSNPQKPHKTQVEQGASTSLREDGRREQKDPQKFMVGNKETLFQTR